VKTFEEIKPLIASKLSVDPDSIKPESRFIEDLGADSLDLADIMMALEERYRIDFGPVDLNEVTTVGGLAKVIDKLTES
jgi:acyl carrier protein